MLVAYWCRNLLAQLVPPLGVPLHMPGELDGRVLGLSVAICVLATLLFGLAPALEGSKLDLANALKLESSGVLGGRDKLVYCLNASTGKPMWTFATRARVDSSPAVAGGRVYIGSNDGRLYVLDLGTGANVWEFEAGAPLSSSPAIANGRVVIGAQDGRVYCFG